MGTALQEAIVEMAKHENSSSVIAERLECSRDYVSRVRSRNGLPAAVGRPVSWDIEQLELARDLLDDGASYRDVAETTGIPKTTLRDRLPGKGFSTEDTANLSTTLARLPENLRWSLTRNRKD